MMMRKGALVKTCAWDGCTRGLGEFNSTGYCTNHGRLRAKVEMKNPVRVLEKRQAREKAEARQREVLQAKQDEAIARYYKEKQRMQGKGGISGRLRGNVGEKHCAFGRIPVTYEFAGYRR